MDLETLRTFVEITRVKNFGRAAGNLCVASSTVSARIRQLERELGVALFRRGYHTVELTPAGDRLLGYARGVLNLWERAHEDVGMHEHAARRLVVAGAISLWDLFLQRWINRILAHDPELSLRAESGTTRRISQKLERGLIDLAFLYEPPRLGQMRIREIAKVALVMVTTRPDRDLDANLRHGYVKVEWGTTFASLHADHFPGRPVAQARVNSGRMALEILLENDGATYLPRIWAEPYLGGRFHLVTDAPEIPLTAYAVYPVRGEQRPHIDALLESLEGQIRDQAPVRADAAPGQVA